MARNIEAGLYVVITDDGDTEQRIMYDLFSHAVEAWREADKLVQRKVLFSVSLRDKDGTQIYYSECDQ